MFLMVLGQLLPRKIAPSPKRNVKPNPNSNTNRGQFSSGAIELLPFLISDFVSTLACEASGMNNRQKTIWFMTLSNKKYLFR